MYLSDVYKLPRFYCLLLLLPFESYSLHERGRQPLLLFYY